jgi:hypothetical protein
MYGGSRHTPNDVRAAAEQSVDFHGRFAPLLVCPECRPGFLQDHPSHAADPEPHDFIVTA